jgi:phosphohistidine phosphatase SixA
MNLHRKDPEPSLTMWGILQCLDKSMEVHGVNDDLQIVFVSPLLRTWLTATLLFLPHTKHIVLQIAPHLKEHHKFYSTGIDTGNLPATPEKQIEKYAEFLNYLQTISKQFEDPTDNNMLSNLKKIMKSPKTITIIDSFHNLELIRFTYTDDKWVKHEDDPNNSRFGGGLFGERKSYVGKIAKQNVWSIKFHADLKMATVEKDNYKSVVEYRDIQFEAGKNKPGKNSVYNLRSSCENLCDFTGLSMSFGKSCDKFSFLQIYNTYTRQTNELYTLPGTIPLQQIGQTSGMTTLTKDYYSTDITKFVEWILKDKHYSKSETVFFVSHSQALQDLSDKLSKYTPLPLITENLKSVDDNVPQSRTASMTNFSVSEDSRDSLDITLQELTARRKRSTFWPFTRKGGKTRRCKKQRKTVKKSRR